MAKLSLIEREKKRSFLYKKYFNKINSLKKIIKGKNSSDYEKKIAKLKLQDIPRNAFAVRMRNRCFVTGRSRGFFRRFGLSRCIIRDLVRKGDIPGVFKAS